MICSVSSKSVWLVHQTIVFFLAAMLYGSTTYAAEPFIIQQASDSMSSLANYLSILSDPSKQITIDDLISGKHKQRFIDEPRLASSASFTNSKVWVHCTIRNMTSSETRLVVELSMARLTHAQWMIVEDGVVRDCTPAGAFEIQEGIVPAKQYPRIAFSLRANQSIDLYLVAESDTLIWFPMVIGSEDVFARFDRMRLMKDFFLLTSCLATAIILLLLGIATRERMYSAIALFTGCYAIRISLFDGHIRMIFPELSLWWERQFYGAITAISVVLILSIDYKLIRLQKIPQWISRLRITVILLFVVGTILTLVLDYRLSIQYLMSISILAGLIYTIVCLSIALRLRTWLAWLWLTIWLFITADIIVQYMTQSMVIPYSRRNYFFPSGIFIFLVWLVNHHLSLIHAKLKLAESLRGEAESKLLALRSQLDPHLLFNCLSSIDALSRDNPAKIPQLVDKLASFLRFRLASPSAMLRPLNDELNALTAYLDIEMIRFGDSLKATFETDEEANDFDVPEFILQPLVENAIKHGFQADKPVELKVKSSVNSGRLLVEISNFSPTQPDIKTLGGFGIGISNTRERLKCLYGSDAKIELLEFDWYKEHGVGSGA